MPAQFSIDETNDYIAVRLTDSHNEKKFIAEHVTSEGVEGRYFNGHNEPGYAASIPTRMLPQFQFHAEHYYRGYSIRTDSAWEFIFNWLIGYAWLYRKWDKRLQGKFNKRSLTRRDRMQLLIFFIDQTIKEDDFKVSSFGLLEKMYTRRWFRHPEHESTERYYSLVMESLVKTEDLRKSGQFSQYELGPNGLSTMAAYELEEQRHNDNKRQQTRIGWLTVALVAIGVIQALVTYLTIPSQP